MSSSQTQESSFSISLKERRNSVFSGWDTAYNIIKSELNSLVSCFSEIRKISSPEFQDLTIKFYAIHLCNFFYFHVRKKLVEKSIGFETCKLLQNGFSNPSYTPTKGVMNDLLSYLIVDDDLLKILSDGYKKLYEIRNKYAHGASNETSINITMDEFMDLYMNVQKI